MPALWHGDDVCLYESLPIIKFLNDRYPDPPLFAGLTPQQVAAHWQQFDAMFDYPLMRTAGFRNLRFWYEWSFMVDDHPSFVAQLGSTLGRPFVTLWMYRLITMARRKIHDEAGGDAIEQVMLPRRTLPALQYFEGLLAQHDGPYLGGHTLSFLDVGLLGQFQCMLGNLSDEVLPLIDQCPSLWAWLHAMHTLPAWMPYRRMYSRAHPAVRDRLQRYQSADAEAPADMLYAGVGGQATYWLGAAAMLAALPVTALALWSTFRKTPFTDGAAQTAKIVGQMDRRGGGGGGGEPRRSKL